MIRQSYHHLWLHRSIVVDRYDVWVVRPKERVRRFIVQTLDTDSCKVSINSCRRCFCKGEAYCYLLLVCNPYVCLCLCRRPCLCTGDNLHCSLIQTGYTFLYFRKVRRCSGRRKAPSVFRLRSKISCRVLCHVAATGPSSKLTEVCSNILCATYTS